MKNIVPEYKNLELEDIEKLITTDSAVDVNPQVYNSEDFGKGSEMVAHYDVLVSCALPGGKVICVGFYFDLEMQRESEPEYPVVKRVFITVADWSADKLNGWGRNHITR